MLNKKKNNKGFTLVELLVVIAIIGILAVVAVPALFKNIEKGKVADLEADISAIRSAALSVYADTSKLPEGIIHGPETTPETPKPSDAPTPTPTPTGGDLIKAELEGLSDPFKATYTTAMGTDEANSNKLILTIEATTQISESGITKLQNDLGDKLISPRTNANPAATDDNTTITVELMSK